MFLNKIYPFCHIPGKYCDLIYYSHEILYLFSPLMLLLTGQRRVMQHRHVHTLTLGQGYLSTI